MTVWRISVVSPMFPGRSACLEVHLFDFDGDLYGAFLSVALIGFQRREATFESMDALAEQMQRDGEEARIALAEARRRGRRSALHPGRAPFRVEGRKSDQYGLLNVQPVFRRVEDRRLRPVHDRVHHLFAPVRGEAVWRKIACGAARAIRSASIR